MFKIPKSVTDKLDVSYKESVHPFSNVSLLTPSLLASTQQRYCIIQSLIIWDYIKQYILFKFEDFMRLLKHEYVQLVSKELSSSYNQ